MPPVRGDGVARSLQKVVGSRSGTPSIPLSLQEITSQASGAEFALWHRREVPDCWSPVDSRREKMKSAAFSESAGQQLAEAVLAAALALPLVFAVGGLKNSRLIKGAASLQTIEWSSSFDSPRQTPQVSATATQVDGLKRVRETKSKSGLGEGRVEIQRIRNSAGVGVTTTAVDDGIHTAVAPARSAALTRQDPRPVRRVIPPEAAPQRGTEF